MWRFPAGKYANPVVADKERMYLTGRARRSTRSRKPGSDVVKAYLNSSVVEKSANALSRRSRSTSSEASGIALDLKRVVEPGQLEHLERGVVGHLSIAPGWIGRAAHQQGR